MSRWISNAPRWALLVALAATPVYAADTGTISTGKIAFEDHCWACHGRERVANDQMMPGTASLALRYQGALPPALEDRTDLAPDFIKYTVRHGVAVMPFFRKTMLSDQDLNSIAAYLSRNYHPTRSAPGKGH
jgi:(+)-pinoresinol hydroxylase